MEEPLPTPARAQATTDCEIINMVKTLNGAIAVVSQDTARIQRAYDKLRAENIARDKALTDLSEIVKEYGSSPLIHWDQYCHIPWISRKDCCLQREVYPFSCTAGMLHCQAASSRWDIVPFHHILRRYYYFTTHTVGGRSLPSSGLLEGLTVFAENTDLVVGRTLVDPSGWRIPVLVSNFGQVTVMV